MTDAKFCLRRIRINRQGYDDAGNYWGVANPLWWFCTADQEHDEYLRADDREHAKEIIRRTRPDAVFYR